MPNGQQQQGFQSFDDFDKFIKQPPSAFPVTPHQAGSAFKDFSDFDSFITSPPKEEKQQQQPAAKPQGPAKYSDVPFFNRPLKKWGERGVVTPPDMVSDLRDRFGVQVDSKDPRLQKIWHEQMDQIDPGKHPINFIEHLFGFHGTSPIHEAAEYAFYESKAGKVLFPTKEEFAKQNIKAIDAALNEATNGRLKITDQQKKVLEAKRQGYIDYARSEGVDPGVVVRSAAVTFTDWETMGAAFKPLEMVGELVKGSKAARTAVYLVNQAIGAEFSIPSFQEAKKQWDEGNYWGASRELGTGAAALLIPLFGHVMSEKNITKEQIQKKAYEVLEEQKQKVAAREKEHPEAVQPVTSQAIEDLQWRVKNEIPFFFGIGRPTPRDIPPPDADLLRVADQKLKDNVEKENIKTRAQARVAEIEKEQRDLADQGRKIAADESLLPEERRKALADLDAKAKGLDQKIAAEKERFKSGVASVEKPTAFEPTPESQPPQKRSFEPTPTEIPGRPQTREERDAEWLDERRKRYQDQLAFEREQRLREGQEFKVEDKRRIGPQLPTEAPEGQLPAPLTPRPSAAMVSPMAPPPRPPEVVAAAIAMENMDLEQQKTSAGPEEAAAIERRQEENRRMAGDIAAAMDARKKPKGFKAGEKLVGPIGKLSELKTVTANYTIRYRVVEAKQLKPSHDPVNFEPVKGYPGGVQERDYFNDKDAQLAVIQHTQGYDPSFTLSDAPGPEHGPPMVTPDGIVLGGNSRAMSTLRLYREGSGAAYRNALLDRLSQLGLDPAEVTAMKEPILVREIISPPQDIQGMRALGSDLNRVFTRKLSEFEQAVSAGKRLSPATLDYILQQLTDLGEGATLRDLLRERSKGILEKLEADGVIAPTERRQFIDEKTDTFNEVGKDFVENAILGSVIDDPQVLANAPKGVLRKIERSLSSIAKIKARSGAWDITDYAKEALREHIAAASKGVSIEDHINPPTALMFARDRIHPIVEGIARKLGESGAEVKKAFDNFAEDAEQDVKDQGAMAFLEPPVPWKSFKENFGVDVRPEEWGTVKAIPNAIPATGVPDSVKAPTPVASLEPPPEPVKKKVSEFTEDFPKRGLEESIKAMTDDDLRTAEKSIESQLRRGEITVRAKKQLEEQAKPFREEMKRRDILDKPERGFGEKNTIFTKDRADAARERLRNKIKGTLYSGLDPELVRDVSEIMGYYFEGGIRDLASISKRVLSEFGDAVRPVLQAAYDQMINKGRVESKTEEQVNLFSPVRGIILPLGVEEEVRRGPETKREERPPTVPLGKTPDEGIRPERREAVRQTPREAARPEGGVREPAPGRAVRPAGKGVGGSGVVERFEQPLRNVQTPRIDAPHITDIPTTVEPTEWRRLLKDANLPETLPPPTETISPEVDEKLAFKGQPEIVRTVLTSLRKYHGAILASSTGTGKTWMGSAILAEKKPRFGLVIAPSKNIAQQWIDTAKIFGVEVKMLEKDIPTEPGIYTTTYSTATNRKGLDKMNFNLVIADESHYARRWHDESNKRGKFLIELGKNADDVLYTSATPFHTPLELGYFEKLGLWQKTGLDNWLRNEFGVRQDAAGKYIVPMNYRKLAALREELISRGMFVNLDRNMDGYSANFAVVPMSEDVQGGIRSATKAFRMAEEYFKSKNLKKMVMAVRGNATTFMKSYLERQRLPQAIELGKKLENEGWKVIYFTETKKEVDEIYDFLKPADEAYGGAISENLPKLPNVVEQLQEAFGDKLANFTGAHSGKRQGDLEAFNSGAKKHLIATYGAGGVGVSLHDLSGDAPRAVIYLGPPWSGVMFDQAIGRPWRFGTKSNVQAYFLTSNAQPEMRLIFGKVMPRFESLKASISGIKKQDPIVSAMKDLDSYLAYEFGNDTKVGFDSFMNTVQTSAVSSYKEAPIVSAEGAKNKGMQVARRELKHLIFGESGELRLGKTPEEEEPPKNLVSVEDVSTEKYQKSIEALRRMFVSEAAGKKITDPRLLDQIDDENRAALGLGGGGEEKPPKPPREVVGNQQIPRPGEAKVSRQDLAYPKAMKWVRDWAEQHFSEWSMPIKAIDALAQVESSWRLGHAEKRDASNVLRQFPETEKIAETATKVERNWYRDVANTQYEYTNILKNLRILGDQIKERKVDQALRLTDQGFKTMSLLGQPSKYLDGSTFTKEELQAAQLIRDRIYEPIWNQVKDVKPEMGYRRKYSAVIPTTEALAASIYPELNGEIPADLRQFFSLEIRRGMTRDPFSPHVLKRRGEPPKTWRISEILDAYVPSMLKVAHYTDASHYVAKQLAGLPERSVLREYATKYARIFFGVPSEYAHMDRIKYRASKMITNALYAGALEANPGWFTMHLTKYPINTWPELGKNGMRYVVKGYSRMMTEDGRELVARSGVLMDKMWVFPDKIYEFKKKPSNWLRVTTSLSDTVDRVASYLAAFEKAKDMGFLGDPEKVGEITWTRLNELAAEGIDTEKAFAYADSVMARSEFFYTPAHVQMWQREHPFLGMFKNYIFREADFISSLRSISKEVKAQEDPEAYIEQKVSEGHYEYIDAIAKYRRFLVSLTGAAITAVGLGGPIFGRFWPLHLGRLLAPSVSLAADTVDLVVKTLEGRATELEWENFAHSLLRMTPYIGGVVGTVDAFTGGPDIKKYTVVRKKKHRDFEPMSGIEKFKFEPLPQ